MWFRDGNADGPAPVSGQVALGPAQPADRPPGSGGPAMADADVDRSLLFGALALKDHFVDRAALTASIQDWSAEKAGPLGQVLVDRGALTADEREVVELLVGKH